MESSAATKARLGLKDKELVAVAASLAAGCIPCTEHHAGAVRQAGATELEVRWAAGVGLAVKARSGEVMAALAAERLNARSTSASGLRIAGTAAESHLEPLVALAAAVGAHCVPAIEDSIAQARQLGWSEHDIRRAVGVGRMVREAGARKADEAASRLLSEPFETDEEVRHDRDDDALRRHVVDAR